MAEDSEVASVGGWLCWCGVFFSGNKLQFVEGPASRQEKQERLFAKFANETTLQLDLS